MADKPKIERVTYSVVEMGRYLGISRNKAYELVRDGVVPHLKFGKRTVIPKAALEAWLLRETEEQTRRRQDESSR